MRNTIMWLSQLNSLVRHRIRTHVFTLSRSSVLMASLWILTFSGSQMWVGHFHWQCVGTGVASLRRAQGCPKSDTDSSSCPSPSIPGHWVPWWGTSGKTNCTAVRSEGNSSVTPGGRRKKGRGCSSSRVDIPLQPMAKIVVRQPVLRQNGESMQEQAPGWACGEEPMQEHIICQVSDPREDPQCSTLVVKDCTEAGKIHKRLYPVDGTPHWSRETEWGRSSKVL